MVQHSPAFVENRVAIPRLPHIETAGRPGPADRVSVSRHLAPNSRPGEDEAPPSATADSRQEISFGPFRLLPAQRLLLEGGRPVRLGGRALDLLFALVARPGEVLGKPELIAKVWPAVFVDDGNLKVQIAALRRALRDGEAGSRYIAAIPGRGYCFVAPLTGASDPDAGLPGRPATRRTHNLPAALTRLVGRDETVARVMQQLSHQRLVTLVGAGGVGKTRVALAVAERLRGDFEHGAWLVDLASIDEPRLVPDALASATGLDAAADDPLRGLLSLLRDKRMLLVLDNCEHVLEPVAEVALRVLQAAPGIRILATSREPLCIEGERAHRLCPLDCPCPSSALGAAAALGFPAVRLFVDRAEGTLGDFALLDGDVPVVVDICQRLGGLPLAIEAAAADLAMFGLAGVQSRLDDPLQLPATRRMVAPRHRSLRAAIDWSYRLLGQDEQSLLQQLAACSDGFTLAEAAAAVTHSDRDLAGRIGALVAKSLVVASQDDAEPRFRLPPLCRAYALEQRVESGAGAAVQRQAPYRHAPAKPARRHGAVIHELRLRSTA